MYSKCFVELSDSSNRSAPLPPALDVCMCVKISFMIHSIRKGQMLLYILLLGVFILVLMIIFMVGVLRGLGMYYAFLIMFTHTRSVIIMINHTL